jgi:hypothetical protein
VLAVSIANIKSSKIAKIRICKKVVAGLLSKGWSRGRSGLWFKIRKIGRKHSIKKTGILTKIRTI